MEVKSEKVKNYIIVTCDSCDESFKIDQKDIMRSNSTDTVKCPWCGKEFQASMFLEEYLYPYIHKGLFSYIESAEE